MKSWSAEEEDFATVVGGPVELARPELGSGKGSPLRSQPHRVTVGVGPLSGVCTAQDRHLLGGVAGLE